MKIEKVDTIDIPENKLKNVDFEGFKANIGTIYEFNGNLYSRSKKNPSIWLICSKKDIFKAKSAKVEKNEDVGVTYNDLVTWINNFKDYVDKRLNYLESKQNEIVYELKEYINYKTI